MKEKSNADLIDLRKFDYPTNSIEIIKDIVNNQNADKEPFYIVDLEDICNKHINWITRLPRVEPHYAIKCNTDSMMLKLLAYLGAGFDCASKNEIQKVLDLGVSPHRIIFANPCKQSSFIKYAYKMGVNYMTFDNELELYKIKEHHPNAKCVLRLITDDRDAVCRFSMKYGADMATALKLVETAVSLNLDLVGVSFHVGSGQMTPKTFSDSIKNARELFDYAREKFGIKFHLLDLGGGYPGSSDSGDFFSMIAREINSALDEYFPEDFFAQLNGNSDENKLRIIAEPGRYYACSAFTLCVNIIGKRVMNQSAEQQKQDQQKLSINNNEHSNSIDTSKSIMYYINDGVYASFNCLFYDHAECLPTLIQDHSESKKQFKSSIWGPTCDGLDVVCKECYLPELYTDEFMVFKNMGAYTLSGAVAFNGIPLARCIYVASTSWDAIKNAFDEPFDESMTTPFNNTSATSASCAIAANLAFSRAMSIQLEMNGGCDSASSHHDEDEKVNAINENNDQKDDLDNTNTNLAVEC